MKKIAVEHQGKQIEVWAEKIKGVVWFHFEGQTYSYAPEKKLKIGQSRGAANSGEIVAPMPGKITKILVKTGQKVGPREAILVMEAMKMEYTLTAEEKGLVDTVHCAVGENVGLGQTLVQLRYEGGANGP